MSIAEIIPGIRALSRSEKFQLAQLLLAELAREELPELFKDGQVYPIYTPEYAPPGCGPTGPGSQGERDSLVSVFEKFPCSAGREMDCPRGGSSVASNQFARSELF